MSPVVAHSPALSKLSQSRWPHRLAAALLGLTFPLIWIGSLVTTTQAGMAVPDWPNTYGYNLFLYPWQTWLWGPWDLLIEHGHRLLASAVGLLTIALAVALFCLDGRRWIRWLGIVAVVGVIGQGVLGGMRVLLDDRTLAKLHGCAGPAFFALCVALWVCTSMWWTNAKRRPTTGGLERLTLITALLSYVQLVLGAQVRHIALGARPDVFQMLVVMHLALALVLLAHVTVLVVRTVHHRRDQPALVRPAMLLGVLMTVQVGLGLATWVVKYGSPAWLADWGWAAGYTVAADSMLQAMTVTAHVATGSLILAVALVLALRCWRLADWGRQAAVAGSATLLGVTT